MRVTPSALADSVGGQWRGPDGASRLVVRVAARAHDGAANAAVLSVVASALGVRKADLRIAAGGQSRSKTIEAAGDGAAIAKKLAALANGPAR